MGMHWEKFSGGPFKRGAEELRATIDRGGNIRINRYTYKALGQPAQVMLHYDRKLNTIGILPARHQNAETFPMIVRRDCQFIIQASSFCHHFGVHVSSTQNVGDPIIDRDGFLQLDLRRTYNVGNYRRRSKPVKPEAQPGK